jgi:hypothetical protein
MLRRKQTGRWDDEEEELQRARDALTSVLEHDNIALLDRRAVARAKELKTEIDRRLELSPTSLAAQAWSSWQDLRDEVLERRFTGVMETAFRSERGAA